MWIKFVTVENLEPTYDGDAPECYELILHQAQLIGGTKFLYEVQDWKS